MFSSWITPLVCLGYIKLHAVDNLDITYKKKYCLCLYEWTFYLKSRTKINKHLRVNHTTLQTHLKKKARRDQNIFFETGNKFTFEHRKCQWKRKTGSKEKPFQIKYLTVFLSTCRGGYRHLRQWTPGKKNKRTRGDGMQANVPVYTELAQVLFQPSLLTFNSRLGSYNAHKWELLHGMLYKFGFQICF